MENEMNMDQLKREIEFEEGVVLEVYLDHLKLPTVGCGHLITKDDEEYQYKKKCLIAIALLTFIPLTGDQSFNSNTPNSTRTKLNGNHAHKEHLGFASILFEFWSTR